MTELQTSFPLDKQPSILDMMQQSANTGYANMHALASAKTIKDANTKELLAGKIAQIRSAATNPQTGQVDRAAYQGALNQSGFGAEADKDQVGQYEAQTKKLEAVHKTIEYVSPLLQVAAEHPEYRAPIIKHANEMSAAVGGNPLQLTENSTPEEFLSAARAGVSMLDQLKMQADELKQRQQQSNSDRTYDLNVFKANNPLPTYNYTTDPGGNVTARDTHNPKNSFDVSGQPMVNVFNPGQGNKQSGQVYGNMSPKTAQLKQEEDLKKTEKAKSSFSEDGQRKTDIVTAANNLSDYMRNLAIYEKESGGNPLIDNGLAFDARAAMGTDTTINNLKSQGQKFLQDYIKSLRALGIAPGQMLNTEKEGERAVSSIIGAGTAASMREAIRSFSKMQKMNFMASEEKRKTDALNAGVPYVPLLDVNILPGPKLYSYKTDGFQIGDEIEDESGKKYRVSGPDIVELVE